MIGVPTLAEVRAWVNVPATSVSDDDLQAILDGELDVQARLCRLPDDPDTTGPATLRVDGYDATVTVVGGPPGRTYRILWGDAATDVEIAPDGSASAEHSYAYAGTYPAAIVDDREAVILTGTVTVPGQTTVPEQGTYPTALSRACLRRCQRQVAARNVPLGVLGTESADFGPISLPSWDAEIARLEASYRIPVVS